MGRGKEREKRKREGLGEWSGKGKAERVRGREGQGMEEKGGREALPQTKIYHCTTAFKLSYTNETPLLKTSDD